MVSPLERLIVNAEEVDAGLLADTLEPFVRIDGSSGAIRTTSKWATLTVPQKIIIGLLARKGAVALGLVPTGDEAISPQECEQTTGIKGGTLRKALSVLYQDRVLQKDGAKYFVPGYAIEEAKTYLPQVENRGGA